MSSSAQLGLLPRLLPVTGSFFGPFAALNAFLSLSVVAARVKTNTYLGDGQPGTKIKITDNISTIDPVLLATRVHSNFLDNIPLALAASAVVELNGGSRKVLTYTLGSLLLLRLSHIHGLTQGFQPTRALGYFGTLGIVTSLGGWAAYLTKGYWGL